MSKFKSIILFIGLITTGIVNGQKKVLTYETDVRPIIQKHCLECHQNNGPGPFPLESYEDVKKRAKFIAHVVEIQYMPPWKADAAFQSYRHERIMTAEEISILKQWASGDQKRGKLRKGKKTKAQKGWPVPDLELKMNTDYDIPTTNTDDFRFFHIPTNLEKDRFITGMAFVPGNKKAVHHSRIMVDTTNEIHGINGMSEMDPLVYRYQKKPLAEEFLYGWVPGNFIFRFPKGFGKKIRHHSDIILNMHYAPSNIYQTDRSSIQMWFENKDEIQREVKTFILRETHISNQPFVLEANTKPVFYMSSGVIENDMSLLTIQPHAHLLGKSFRAFAITQEGDMIPLIKIDKWDFNWQTTYEFNTLIHIPAGSVIIMEGQYDNTTDNPRNPNQPPVDVGYGWRTVDEMMNLIMYYVDYQPGDENKELEYPVFQD